MKFKIWEPSCLTSKQPLEDRSASEIPPIRRSWNFTKHCQNCQHSSVMGIQNYISPHSANDLSLKDVLGIPFSTAGECDSCPLFTIAQGFMQSLRMWETAIQFPSVTHRIQNHTSKENDLSIRQ